MRKIMVKSTRISFLGLMPIVISVVSMFFANDLNARATGLNPDSLLNDVNVLFEGIAEIHPDMFAAFDEKDFAEELFAIKSGINDKTEIVDFYVSINSLVVKLNDGHTYVSFPYAELKRPDALLFPFPAEVSSIDSSVRVINDYTKSGNSIPVNSEILSINGIETKEIVGKMIGQVSGEKTFYRIDRLTYLFTPLLYALYKSQEFEIEYRHDESTCKERIRGIPYSERYERQSKTNANRAIEPYSIRIDHGFSSIRGFG